MLLLLLLLLIVVLLLHSTCLLCVSGGMFPCHSLVSACVLQMHRTQHILCVFIGAHGISAAHKAQGIEHSILFFCKGKVHCRVEKADDSTPYDVTCMKYGAPVTTPSVPISAASNPC